MTALNYSKGSVSLATNKLHVGGGWTLLGHVQMNYVFPNDNFIFSGQAQVTNGINRQAGQANQPTVGWTLLLRWSRNQGSSWSNLDGQRLGQNVDGVRHHDVLALTSMLWWQGGHEENIRFGVFARCYSDHPAAQGKSLDVDRVYAGVCHHRQFPHTDHPSHPSYGQ